MDGPPESYRLSLGPDGVSFSAASDAGLVEPRVDTTGWILEVRARFEDARHRLA